MATTQECCEQFWTSPGSNTLQSSSCTATYLPSRKLRVRLKVRLTRHAGHCWRSRDELISVLLWTPPYMAKQKQVDQLEPTYSSSVRIRDVALRTCQKRWTIGRSGERGSGISVLVAWQDDDDMIHRCDPYRNYHSGSDVGRGLIGMNGNATFHKASQLGGFNILSRTHVGDGGLTSKQEWWRKIKYMKNLLFTG